MNRLTGFGFGALALALTASAIAPAQAADLDYRYEERRTQEYRVVPQERYVERYEVREPARVYVEEEPVEEVVIVRRPRPRYHVHAYPAPVYAPPPVYAPRAHYAAPPYGVAVEADVLLPPALVGPRW